MRNTIKILSVLILLAFSVFPQNQVKIMTYNILNYPGSDTTFRNPYFRTVISNTLPDVLVVQEINSQNGVNSFLHNVLRNYLNKSAAGCFIDGSNTYNAVFFDSTLTRQRSDYNFY